MRTHFEKKVFLHSMIRDAHGRKMSKSLGNVLDPLDVISGVSLQRLHEKLNDGNLDPREIALVEEGQRKDFPAGIPECGTDALRFALCSHRVQGDDINLDVTAVLSVRHFCNKVWNSLKFTLAALGEDFVPKPLHELSLNCPMNRWICSRLAHTVADCNRYFEGYEFHAVTSAIHGFWLQNFCDVYLESVKPLLKSGDLPRIQETQQMLYWTSEITLRLLSPFMPFLTEELWQRLPQLKGDPTPSICVAQYPSAEQMECFRQPQVEANFQLVQEVVHVIRSLRAIYQLSKVRPEVMVLCSETDVMRILQKYQDPLQTLSFSGALTVLPSSKDGVPIGFAVGFVNDRCMVLLNLQGLVDPQQELLKLTLRQQKLERQLSELSAQIQTAGYSEKVSQIVQDEHQQKISALQTKLNNLDQATLSFQRMLSDSEKVGV